MSGNESRTIASRREDEALITHWDIIPDTCDEAKHEVLKVYTFDQEGKDVFCTAKLTMTLKSGQVVEKPFAMSFQIEGEGIRYIESVIDYAPLRRCSWGLWRSRGLV